jgi:S1-C subfamily serine protease
MSISKFSSILMLAMAASAAAQNRLCPSGPGVALGITDYSCANCGMKQVDGRMTYTFGSEPVVTQTVPTDAPIYVVDGQKLGGNPVVAVGDVIVSVNGHPITTREGADEFVNPSKEWISLIVHRTRNGKTSEVAIAARCRMTRELYDRLKSGLPPQSPDSVVARFGFAVECHPSCSMRRAPDGVFDYKYNGLPEIVFVRPGSVADKTGLKVGDLIVDVDGRSITENGALQGAARRDDLRMTIRRGGKDVSVHMFVTRS